VFKNIVLAICGTLLLALVLYAAGIIGYCLRELTHYCPGG